MTTYFLNTLFQPGLRRHDRIVLVHPAGPHTFAVQNLDEYVVVFDRQHLDLAVNPVEVMKTFFTLLLQLVGIDVRRDRILRIHFLLMGIDLLAAGFDLALELFDAFLAGLFAALDHAPLQPDP